MARRSEPENGVQGFRVGLGSRLRLVESRFKNRAEAAKAAGVAKSTFQNWVEGKADPSFAGLTRLASVSNVSLDWLATGQGPMRPGEDADLQPLPAPADTKRAEPRIMSRCVDAYMRLYAELKIPLPPMALGELATAAYNEVAAAGNTEEEWIVALRVVINRHRRDLVAELTANANGKRSA